MTITRTIQLAALTLFTTTSFASPSATMSLICPSLEQLQCKPSFNDCDEDRSVYCSGTWTGINNDGKLFASRTDIDCNGTLISWLPAKSEFIDGYKAKCTYQLKDGVGILYDMTLYNEKGYQLNDQGHVVSRPDKD